MDEKGIKIDEEDVDEEDNEAEAESGAGAADKSDTGRAKADGKNVETLHTNKSIDGLE